MIVFGEWLKEELKRQNVSQFELATRMEVEQSLVCKWVNQRNDPNIKNMQRALDELGYHIEIVKNA